MRLPPTMAVTSATAMSCAGVPYRRALLDGPTQMPIGMGADATRWHQRAHVVVRDDRTRG